VTWWSWSKSNYIYIYMCVCVLKWYYKWNQVRFNNFTVTSTYRVRDQLAKSKSLLEQIVGHPCKWHPSFTKDWLLQLIIILCSMKQPIQNFLGYIYIYIYIWIYFTIIYRNYFFFLTATMRLQLFLIRQNKPWIFFSSKNQKTNHKEHILFYNSASIWRKNVHFQW